MTKHGLGGLRCQQSSCGTHNEIRSAVQAKSSAVIAKVANGLLKLDVQLPSSCQTQVSFKLYLDLHLCSGNVPHERDDPERQTYVLGGAVPVGERATNSFNHQICAVVKTLAYTRAKVHLSTH